MRLAIIVAASENHVIGKDNRLLWHLPDDLKFFQTSTLGHHMIMGRKTFEALGKPLKGRTSVVITRNRDFSYPGVMVVSSLKEAVSLETVAKEDLVFIIGGGEIYRQSLPITDEIFLTRIHADFEGDTWFPVLKPEEWSIQSEVYHPQDEKHRYPFSFIHLIRKK